jgi:hypothetical protein
MAFNTHIPCVYYILRVTSLKVHSDIYSATICKKKCVYEKKSYYMDLDEDMRTFLY